MRQSCQHFGRPTHPNGPSRSGFQVAALGVPALQIRFTQAALAVALLLSAILPFTATATSPAPRMPLTHELLWVMKRVGTPAVSPDGKWVVFSVLEPSYDPDKETSDLWLVPADGTAAPRRITHTRAPESGVSWSPDSRSIAFASKREGDEHEQIYLLELASGGEARRLTELSTGASSPTWRPDGKAILFESTVYPDALGDDANREIAAERRTRKYNVRVYEHFPVRQWSQWLDERQPAVMVQSLEPGAKPRDILSATALAHSAGFAGVADPMSAGSSLAPIWSPDGKEILFTATTQRWAAPFGYVSFHLYRVAVDGGAEPKIVTPASGNYDDAQFSPDGKSLYFKLEPQDEKGYHLARLNRVPWPAGGEATPVAGDFDREIAVYAITPDSHTIYLLATEGANESLFRVSATGAKPTAVIQPAIGGYTALVIPQKAARPMLIATYGSSVRPLEIVRIDPTARRHAELTQFDTATAATIDWQPPQHFYFTSTNGRNIHNMIVLPPAFDPAKKYPLITLIHGGPAISNPDQISLRWNYHLLAAPGYVILLTDYTGSAGFGEKFVQAIIHDPLKTPSDDLNQAVDEAIRRYPFIDGTRLCAAGASYGGHLANWIEATTTRYKCIVSHAGEVDLTTEWGESDGIYEREIMNGGPPWAGNPIWREQSSITYAANWKTPMLLSIGERDFRVPIGNTLENWATLQRMRVPSRLLVWPDASHWILKAEDNRHFYEEVQRWLATYLKE
jgi:dipeptidyl aminopeptidase/acylaminoacyl peptidase